jgi:molybdate transport system substrate-binding protein
VVYVTDVLSAGDMVKGVSFPEASNAVNDYPIAVLRNATQPELAMEFVGLVKGPDGQKALGAAGFGAA